MGDRANGLLPESPDDLGDVRHTLLKLRSTRSEVIAVRDYWNSIQEDCDRYETEWCATLLSPERIWYRGPGGFFVRYESGNIVIKGGCRWSGFCTIPELQRVHAAAFLSIGRALGGSRLILLPDSQYTDDCLYDGLTQTEYLKRLSEAWGMARTEFGIVTTDMDAYYSRPTPVWFLIEL